MLNEKVRVGRERRNLKMQQCASSGAPPTRTVAACAARCLTRWQPAAPRCPVHPSPCRVMSRAPHDASFAPIVAGTRRQSVSGRSRPKRCAPPPCGAQKLRAALATLALQSSQLWWLAFERMWRAVAAISRIRLRCSIRGASAGKPPIPNDLSWRNRRCRRTATHSGCPRSAASCCGVTKPDQPPCMHAVRSAPAACSMAMQS